MLTWRTQPNLTSQGVTRPTGKGRGRSSGTPFSLESPPATADITCYHLAISPALTLCTPSQLLPRRLREPLLYLVLKTLLETQARLYRPGHREQGAGIQDSKVTQIPRVKQQPARTSSTHHSTPWASRPQVSLRIPHTQSNSERQLKALAA